MGRDVPTVTRSKHKVVSQHLAPINAGQVRAHSVGKHTFGLLQWAPGVCLVILVLTAGLAGMWTIRTLSYASVGQSICERPLMTLPRYSCDTEGACAASAEVMAVRHMELQANSWNGWQAEACLAVPWT